MDVEGKATGPMSRISAVSGSMLDLTSAGCSDSEDAPMCWICLDYSGELIEPCKCPRVAHPACLARWQLQSAGTRKEHYCEFCDALLPNWKGALAPVGAAAAPAVMNVNFDGRTYSFEVAPGPDGYRLFTEAIRRAFALPGDSELNITFTCDEPTAPADSGSLLTLQGAGAYDAAVHCASVSAARRAASGGSTPAPRSPCGARGAGLADSPRSAAGLAREASQQSALSAGAGSPGGARGARGGGRPLPPATKRRLSTLGRRLRSALHELLSVKD